MGCEPPNTSEEGDGSPLARWLRHLEVRRVSKATLRSYRFDMVGRAGLLAFLREETPDAKEDIWKRALDLTAVDFTLYVRFLLQEHGPMAAATLKRKTASLRAFLDWAVGAGLRTRPVPETPKLPTAAPLAPRWLDRNQVNGLLRAVERSGSSRDQAIITLLLETGLRVGELCGLRLCDVEMSKKAGVAWVLGKGAKVRQVPLNAEARAALRELGVSDGPRPLTDERPLLGGQRGCLTTSGVLKRVRRCGKQAGFPLSPHTLRHTFCRRHIDARTPISDLALMVGHASLDTTKKYTTPSLVQLQEAAENVSVVAGV